MTKPTFAGAASRIKDDSQARFVVVLATTFAFSLGFVLGLLIGESDSRESTSGD